MRQFSLTNPVFTGEIIIKYNLDGLLVGFDATETTVQFEHIRWLLLRIPAQITDHYMNELMEFLKGTKCHLVETQMDVSFDVFWEQYKKKINALRAKQLYNKLSDANKYLCILSIKKYDKYLARVKYRNKQDPDTYLRNQNYLTDWDSLND